MNRHQLKQYLGNNIWYGENSHRQNRAKHLSGVPFLERQAIVSLVMPDTTRVWGIDISHWNRPPVNLIRMVELYSLDFVIIKGCDGSLNTRYYLEHVATAKAAGIPWGMYVWLYPANKVNMDAQVNTWHARYLADPPPLGVFIDCEWTNYDGLPANPNANDLRQAHDKWKSKSGQTAITYTAKGYADTYLIGFDWTREPLWAASWGGNTPLLPIGAHDYKLWQFGILDGKKLDPNGNAELDGDYDNGFVPQPPPNGEIPMDKYMKVTDAVTQSLNIRTSGANLGAENDLGAFNLLRGDIIHVIESNPAHYQRFDRLYRNNVLTELPTSPTGQYWSLETDGVNVWLMDTQYTPPAPIITDVDIQLVKGSTVTTHYSDGTEKVETA